MERDVELTPQQAEAVRNMQVTVETAEKRDKRTSYEIKVVLPNSSHAVWKNSKEFQEFDADWRATFPECHNPFVIPVSKKFLSAEENTKIKIAKMQNYLEYMCTLPDTFPHLLQFLGIGSAALPQRRRRRLSARSNTQLPMKPKESSLPHRAATVCSVPERDVPHMPRLPPHGGGGGFPRLPMRPPGRPSIQKLPRSSSRSVGNGDESPRLPPKPRSRASTTHTSPKFSRPHQVSSTSKPKLRLPPKPTGAMPSPKNTHGKRLPAAGRTSPGGFSAGRHDLIGRPNLANSGLKTRRRLPPTPRDFTRSQSVNDVTARPGRISIRQSTEQSISTRFKLRGLPPRPLTSLPPNTVPLNRQRAATTTTSDGTGTSGSNHNFLRSQTMLDPSLHAKTLPNATDLEELKCDDIIALDEKLADLQQEIKNLVSQQRFEDCIKPRDQLKAAEEERRKLIEQKVEELNVRIQECKQTSKEMAKQWDFEGCIHVRAQMEHFEKQKQRLMDGLD